MSTENTGAALDAELVLGVLRRHRGTRDLADDLEAAEAVLIQRRAAWIGEGSSRGAWARIRTAADHARRAREGQVNMDRARAYQAQLVALLDDGLRTVAPAAAETLRFDAAMTWLPEMVEVVDRLNPEQFAVIAGVLHQELIRSGDVQTGEHRTAAGLADLAAALVEPQAGERVLDPAASDAELLAAVIRWVGPGGRVDAAGRTSNAKTRNLAEFNLRLHGQPDADIRLTDAGLPTGPFDVVVSNPPYAGGAAAAVLRLALDLLGPRGRAAIIMPSGFAGSRREQEMEQRRQVVDSGRLRAVISLPSNLFADTGVAPHLWVLATDRRSRVVSSQRAVLLVDASRLGVLRSKTNRILTGDDVAELITCLREQATEASATSPEVGQRWASGRLNGVSITVEELAKSDYMVTPQRHFSHGAAQNAVTTKPRTTAEIVARLSEISAECVQLDWLIGQLSERSRWSGSQRSHQPSLIGPVPSNFRRVKLAELLAESTHGRGKFVLTGPAGSVIPKSSYVPEGVPVIMARDIGENGLCADQAGRIPEDRAKQLHAFRLQAGDIVLARRGEMGRRALVGPEQAGWLFGTGCIRVRCGNAIDPGYAAAYFGRPEVRQWLTAHAQGTTALLSISAKTLGELEIVVPHLEIQQAVREAHEATTRRLALTVESAALAAELRIAVSTEIMGG